MILTDAEEVKVVITYELEFNKEDLKDYENTSDIIRMAEEEAVSGSGHHDYAIYGIAEDGTESTLYDSEEEENQYK